MSSRSVELTISSPESGVNVRSQKNGSPNTVFSSFPLRASPGGHEAVVIIHARDQFSVRRPGQAEVRECEWRLREITAAWDVLAW